MKACAPDERDGRDVHGQDVRLHAMEPERTEGMAKRERQRFRHVALAGVGDADPIAEERALGRTADDLVQVDGAQDRTIRLPADQELLVAPALGARQPLHEELAGSLASGGGRLPALEEGRAPAPQGHVLAVVARGGASQVDALADLDRAGERRSPALGHRPSLHERWGLWPRLARRDGERCPPGYRCRQRATSDRAHEPWSSLDRGAATHGETTGASAGATRVFRVASVLARQAIFRDPPFRAGFGARGDSRRAETAVGRPPRLPARLCWRRFIRSTTLPSWVGVSSLSRGVVPFSFARIRRRRFL